MNKSEELDAIESYEFLLNQFGISYQALNWGSKKGQELRFKILAEIGSLEGKKILDVGCGLGDFAAWLMEKNICVDYTGIDITPGLIFEARKRFPSLNFIEGSILDQKLFIGNKFNYVFASGIFYTYSSSGDDWLKSAILRMWELSSDGIAFNSLSAWANEKYPKEYYANPSMAIDYCKELTPCVTLRHDYHPRDFTAYLFRSLQNDCFD